MESIFPDKEPAYTEDIFPTSETEPFLVKERREFLVGLAERYADRKGMTVPEAVDKALYEGGKAITPDEGLPISETDVFLKAYERKLPAVDMKTAMDNFYENKKILSNSYEDRDVAEKIIKDPLDVADVRLLKLAKLRTAIQKVTPERGYAGTAWDFLGYLGREVTWGIPENLAGATGLGGKSGAAADWYKRLMDAPIDQADAVADQIAKEISDFGVVGDNIFYLSTLGASVEEQGMYENEVLWSVIDIATLGVGRGARAVKATEEAATATRIATAVDPADMKIATNGVAEGDKVVLKALVEGQETSIELARQTSPGMSRVATVNAENAITPTLKPVLDAESVAKVNQTLERVTKIYSSLKTTPEVIAKSAAKYVEDLQRTTGYGLLNVTRDIPVVKPIKATRGPVKAPFEARTLNEGVDPTVYKKAVDLVNKTTKEGSNTWSLSAFMKESGLTKEQSFPYVKQLRDDNVISGSKIVSFKAGDTVPAKAEALGPVPTAPVSVQEAGYDTYSITAYLGKKDGTLWTTEAAGRKAAEQLGGTLVKVVDGWAVSRSRVLPIKYLEESGLGAEQQALRTFIFEAVLSPEQTTNLANEVILKSGTSKLNAVIRQIGRDIKKSWRGLSSKERQGLEAVFNDLTSDYARRDWYNTSEFKDKFFKHTKEVASQKVMDHYRLRAEMYDTAFVLRAESELKKAVSDNEFIGTFNGLGSRRVKKVSVKEEEDVFDLDTGQLVKAKDLSNRTVYELHGEQGLEIGDFKQYYITGSLKNNRALTHSDVLGYKPGANRALGNASHFVIQEKVVETISGTKKTLTPKTILAERNTLQSGKAVTEINNILKAIREAGVGNLPRIKAAGLDDIIRANNSFNPNLESVDDFLKFMDEAGLGYDDVRVVRADDTFEGRSFSDIYDSNTNPVGRRPDLILHGYGAKGILMRNPLEAIERDFSRGVNIAATTKYFDKAMSDFIRNGEKYISNWESIKNMPKYQQVREAVFTSDSVQARAFKREQTVILSRLNEQSDFSMAWSRRMTQLNSWIFSWSGREEFGIGNMKVGAMDFMSSDPTTALRGFAFDLKMGWFAVDQLYMQSMGALAIMSIDPKNGLLGALAYTPMRIVMMNRNPAVIKETARRTSKALGLTEEQFIEMTDHLYNSGRFDIGDTIAEIGGGADFGLGYYKRAKEAGRVFFREGERINRMLSHYVAYKNFREKFPALDIKTAEGQRIMDEFITQRADTLTLNMTSVSNAPWQKGFLGLTTQWLSYNARFLENVFLSRSLTGGITGERARLALSQLVFFGAAGIGVGTPLNWYLEESETTLSPEAYTALRYGLLDSFLTEMSGTPTALSGRAGLGEGIVQLVKDFYSEGALETLAGPATGIGYDTFKDGWNILTSLVTGNITMIEVNVEKFLRNAKTVDKIYQTMWAYNTRDIITKKGFEQIRDASNAQIVLNALAVPLQEAQVGFTISEMLTKQRDYTKKMANLAKDLYKRMDVAIEDGDMKAAQDLATEINTIRLGIAPSEIEEFMRMSSEGMSSFAEKMIMKAWEEGKATTALRSQQIISNEE